MVHRVDSVVAEQHEVEAGRGKTRKVARIEHLEIDRGVAPAAALDHFTGIIDTHIIGAKLVKEWRRSSAANFQVENTSAADVPAIAREDRRLVRMRPRSARIMRAEKQPLVESMVGIQIHVRHLKAVRTKGVRRRNADGDDVPRRHSSDEQARRARARRPRRSRHGPRPGRSTA